MRREGQDLTKPWFDQPKTFVTPYQLKAPYDNIWVGEDPTDGMTKEYADTWDAIVNVSSTKCALFEPSRPDQKMYWYPVIEMGRWSLGYLYWLKHVMDFHHSKGHKIYLHCHAGAFRSPSAATLWLQSLGHTFQEARAIQEKDSNDFLQRIWKRQGNLPSRTYDLFEMLRENPDGCLESLLTYKMIDPWDHETMSGFYRRSRILRHYLWFYYEPSYWLRSRWSEFKDWAFKRYGWYSEGFGKYLYERKYFWAWPENAEPKNSYVVWGKQWDPATKTFIFKKDDK